MTRPLRILHVVISLGPASPEYNEHCLPVAQERDLAICSFLKAKIVPPPHIMLFEGDGTLRGFWRAMNSALQAGNYDVIHVHQQQIGALLLLIKLVRWKSLANMVCTIHNSWQSFRLRNKALLIPVLAFFPKIVLCSKSALESMPLQRLLRGNRVTVVQNGVDTARVHRVLATFPEDSQDDRFKIVCVGRLISRKNPATILQAFNRLHESHSTLVYVGDGDLRQALLDKARGVGIGERVTVTGLVQRDDVYRYAAQGDVCVSASRGEGLPVAVLETMACGRPVILSDIPPHREIVAGVDFVPLIAPDDIDGFARQLRRLRELSPEQRAVMGDSCRRLVEERFSLQAMHRGYDDVYREVMPRHIRRKKAP
jgi:glycosyltransferase involved in cell wall biosynthesis